MARPPINPPIDPTTPPPIGPPPRDESASRHDASLADEHDASPRDESRPAGHKVGALVTFTYRDPYIGAGGADVTQVGFVTAIVDGGEGPDGEQKPPGYRVAWLAPASDPLSADDLAPISTEPTSAS